MKGFPTFTAPENEGMFAKKGTILKGPIHLPSINFQGIC